MIENIKTLYARVIFGGLPVVELLRVLADVHSTTGIPSQRCTHILGSLWLIDACHGANTFEGKHVLTKATKVEKAFSLSLPAPG